MSNDVIEQAIQTYEKYCARFATGFLDAAFESGLTGAISLSDSTISSPAFSADFLPQMHNMQVVLERYHARFGDRPIDIGAMSAQDPELALTLEHLEMWLHETFHGLQKHAYGTLFSLVDAIQKVESWETLLFLNRASAGGHWELGSSFMSCLQDTRAQFGTGLAHMIIDSCNAILQATAPRANGLGLLDLVEGQALVASRLACGVFDARPLPQQEVYTRAWRAYQCFGGKIPLVFVLIVSAALRYGDMETEGSLGGMYPHPVDIFNFLIQLAPEIESVYHAVDVAPQTWLTKHGAPRTENLKTADYDAAVHVLMEHLRESGIRPCDSDDPDLSYVRADVGRMPCSSEKTSSVSALNWYYQLCGSCNADGSYNNINPDCGRCSGIGEDWDEGEDARERLRRVYGKEPMTGTPPQYNYFGRRLFTSVEELDDYEENQEQVELDRKLHATIWRAFDPVSQSYLQEAPLKRQAIQIGVLVSQAIAQVVESSYSRVASSMADELPRKASKRIADAVANDYIQCYPDFYQEETIVRSLLDMEFMTGDLLGYFLYRMQKTVKVKPLDVMDAMSHGEYQFIRLMPEGVKKILAIYRWRKSENEDVPDQPMTPYCCSRHGVLDLNEADPAFLDSCTEEDSAGQLLQHMLGRNFASLIQ